MFMKSGDIIKQSEEDSGSDDYPRRSHGFEGGSSNCLSRLHAVENGSNNSLLKATGG